jgi:hypothetical protein
MVASILGDLEGVRELLAHGADVNKASQNGKTALRFATLPAIRELLLQHGAVEAVAIGAAAVEAVVEDAEEGDADDGEDEGWEEDWEE